MRTVLIIDDDSDIRELVVWKLAQAGYATLSASDGAEGLAAALTGDSQGRLPDLILVDWMMPKMTGIELCRAVRATPSSAVPHHPAHRQRRGVGGRERLRGRRRRLHDQAVQPPGAARAHSGRPVEVRGPGVMASGVAAAGAAGAVLALVAIGSTVVEPRIRP